MAPFDPLTDLPDPLRRALDAELRAPAEAREAEATDASLDRVLQAIEAREGTTQDLRERKRRLGHFPHLQVGLNRGMPRGGVFSRQTLPVERASPSVISARQSRATVQWITFPLLLVGILTLGVVLHSHASSRHSAPARRYATNTGQRATITLRDGSRIILAPHTQLSIARDFGQHERTVTLTGEAYFDVVAAARAPFVVRSGPVTTRVLGTTFEIRHYPADPEVRVAVVTGKVMAQGARAPMLLTAGTVGHLTDSSITTTAVSDTRAYTEWTNDELVFTDTPVPTLLATLRHWYGYDFQLTDATLNARHVTTVLPAANSAELFVILRDLLGVSVTVEHQTVTLRPRRQSRDVPQTSHPVANPHPVLEVGR